MLTKVSSLVLILLLVGTRAEGENDLFTGNSEQLDVQSKSDSWEPINDGANKDVGQEDEIAESKGVEAFQDDDDEADRGVTENLPAYTTTNEVEMEDAMEGTDDNESILQDDETELKEDETELEEDETEHEEDETEHEEDETEHKEDTETIEIGSEESNDVSDQVSCKCKDKTNKALISSLQACTSALSVLQNCKKPKKQNPVSKKALTSCKCSAKLTAALTNSLKSCTDALGSMTSCKGGTKVTASSCAGVLKQNPNANSGFYKLRVNGKTVRAYCLMGRLCGRKGGWTRLGFFNANRRRSCPSGLQLYRPNKANKMCGKAARAGAGCVSINLPSNGIKYSTVCGNVKGYQKGTTDGFSNRGINSVYLDGVSITRGSPRTHVWSLAAGHTERTTSAAACPCNRGASKSSLPPAFVGRNYYCESAWGKSLAPANRILTGDPLWDGKKMRRRETSCRVFMMPWFRRDIGSVTKDNIEMRLCTDEPASNENIGIGRYAIFVK